MRARSLRGTGWFAALAFVHSALAAAPLFEPAPRTPLAAPRSTRDGLALRRASDRPVEQWQAGDVWSVPAPDGAELVWRVRDVRFAEDGGRVVTGEIVGEPGSELHLSSCGEAMAATLRSRQGRTWVLEPRSDGFHRIRELQTDVGPDCGNPRVAEGPPLNLEALRPGPKIRAAGAGIVTSVVDLAFVYTPAAEAGAGGPSGMRALLDLAVLEANDAYARSGAHLELRAVAHELVNYVESGDLQTDLSRLTRTDDHQIDEVHALRDATAADVVCLVVESEAGNRLAGMANQLLGTTPELASRGFTACVRPYMVGNYTLPHEVGHLLGCDHDRENASGGALSAWSYGTRITVDGVVYRTVMAYRPGVQFPHFSNPDVLFRGVATGVADGRNAANNVRTLNQTSALIAAVRDPVSRLGFTAETFSAAESAGSLRLTLHREGMLAAAQVDFATVPGSARAGVDYVPVRQRLTLPAEQADVAVEIPLIDNAALDGPRRLGVTLSGPSAGLALGPITTATVTVTDDEADGRAVLDSGFRPQPGTDYSVAALAADPDGRVLAGGTFATVNGEVHRRLARLLPDGSADSAFVPEAKYAVSALARMADGRIALAGDFNTVNTVRLNHVAVLRPDGTLDPGFEFDAGTDYPVRALAPLADGRLLIGGAFTNVQGRSATRVARLLPSGQPDPSFGLRAVPDDEVRALALTGDGRVVIGGRFGQVTGRLRPGLDRLLPDGAPDDAFAATGTANGPVNAVAVDATGGVLVAGEFTRFLGTDAGRIVRLGPTGQRDPAFRAGQGADGSIFALGVAQDGSIWIGGRFTSFDGQPRRRVARLRPDGSLDAGFDPGAGPDDDVLAVLARDDGGVVIGGVFTTVSGVARGGLARLLGGAPVPAVFEAISLGEWGLRWQAKVAPRQAYELERSGDLRTWWFQSRVSAESGVLGGEMNRSAAEASFLRLRRRLE